MPSFQTLSPVLRKTTRDFYCWANFAFLSLVEPIGFLCGKMEN